MPGCSSWRRRRRWCCGSRPPRRVFVDGVSGGLASFLGMPVRTSFTARWESLLLTAPPAVALGCAAAGVGALAGLAVAGRPTFLVPVAGARRAAAALAASTAVVAAAVGVATVVHLTHPADPRTDRMTAFAPGTADVPAAAPTLGVLAFVLATCVLSTVVLLRPVPARVGAPTSGASPTHPPDPALDVPDAAVDVPPDTAQPLVADVVPGLPHPPDEELARYRRPR